MLRNHDAFYLNEDNTNVKESFIRVADKLPDGFSGSICDIGCATGAFPAYLTKRFAEARVTGLEIRHDLLEKAKSDFAFVNFLPGDITNPKTIDRTYDVITMLGVLCIFDDYQKIIKNAANCLNAKGLLILHNMVSEFDIDVFVKYRKSSAIFDEEQLESGWNIISRNSLVAAAELSGLQLLEIDDFKLSVDLLPTTHDALRSWTEKNALGEREIFNGLHLRQPQKVVVFQKID